MPIATLHPPRFLLLLLVVIAVVFPTAASECRKAPLPPPQRKFDPTSVDADGILRTERNCKTSDGHVCDLCCDGMCCEAVHNAPTFPPMTQMWIPLRLVVLSADPEHHLNSSSMELQMNIVNQAFVNTSFRFYVESYEHFANDERLIAGCNTDPCYADPSSCDFYQYVMPRVMQSPEWVVNVMICSSIYYEGESQFPWATVEESNMQYVTVRAATFSDWGTPGSSRSGGMTLVHELGHYLGLLHTFERAGTCDVDGDLVDDTPPASVAAKGTESCDHISDSCPQLPGADDHNNFMNYAADHCMSHFTEGQVLRMERAVRRYRPKLFHNRKVAGLCAATMYTAPMTGLCTCYDDNMTPESHCTSNETATLSPSPHILSGVPSSVPATQTTPLVTTAPPATISPPTPTTTAAGNHGTSNAAPTSTLSTDVLTQTEYLLPSSTIGAPPPTSIAASQQTPSLAPSPTTNFVEGTRVEGSTVAEDNGTGISNIGLLVTIVLSSFAVVAILIAIGVVFGLRWHKRKQAKIENTLATMRSVTATANVLPAPAVVNVAPRPQQPRFHRVASRQFETKESK